MRLSQVLRRFVKPSTAAFWREALSRPGGSLKEALHGFFYLKWPEFYIGVGLGRGRLGKAVHEPVRRIGRALGLWDENAGASFADTYHGKVMPLAETTRLITVGRPLRLETPEKVLPYSMARDIILENPDDLALLRCPCRATMPEPCEPLDVCIIVGRPVTDFVLEHHPDKARKITVDEAARVVLDEQKRGHVSHAFFKEAVLGRYYAICNCCSCCCGAMQAFREGTPMLASSGYVAVCDEETCVGCGKCAAVCPFGAIAMQERAGCNGRAGQNGRNAKRPVAVIDGALCMGCGVCALRCKKEALRLELDPAKPLPLWLKDRMAETG